MGSLVQLGDVPAWIGAATGAASVYLGLRDRQQAQALNWAQTLEELTSLTGPELRQIVEDNPVIAQMVDLAWEEAAKTTSENKRRLLAKVVAAAIRGDAAAEVDPHPFLLRSVMALDHGHVTLLVLVATPLRTAGQVLSDADLPSAEFDKAADREELLARWPATPDLLDPALAALEREGLIQLGPRSGCPAARAWRLTARAAQLGHAAIAVTSLPSKRLHAPPPIGRLHRAGLLGAWHPKASKLGVDLGQALAQQRLGVAAGALAPVEDLAQPGDLAQPQARPLGALDQPQPLHRALVVAAVAGRAPRCRR
jgi:hypothetical protein